MTRKYLPVNLKLSQPQWIQLAKGEHITIPNVGQVGSGMRADHKKFAALTQSQIKLLAKAMSNQQGAGLKMSKAQLNWIEQHGSGTWFADLIKKVKKLAAKGYSYAAPIAKASFDVVKQVALDQGDKLVRQGMTKLEQAAIERLNRASNNVSQQIAQANLTGAGIAKVKVKKVVRKRKGKAAKKVIDVNMEFEQPEVVMNTKSTRGLSRFGIGSTGTLIQQGEGFRDFMKTIGNSVGNELQKAAPILISAGSNYLTDQATTRLQRKQRGGALPRPVRPTKMKIQAGSSLFTPQGGASLFIPQ